MSSQINDKVAIQLPLVFQKESYGNSTFGSEDWPFLKFSLQSSILHTNSSRTGKLIAKVIAMLMHYYKLVHNTDVDYMVINWFFIDLIKNTCCFIRIFQKKQVELDLLKTNKTQGQVHYFKLLLLLVAFRPQEQGNVLGLQPKLEQRQQAGKWERGGAPRLLESAAEFWQVKIISIHNVSCYFHFQIDNTI